VYALGSNAAASSAISSGDSTLKRALALSRPISSSWNPDVAMIYVILADGFVEAGD
jgi:hypothetical protein